ncbi:SLC45 family MFS transporter [Liquorilactobacillus mali]|uniref:Major facilitator superfamily permease n=1 Tax=Liquorilactobacillus mali KCTC 3596 = DSM 20444 TaxID=1046596 RepID=J0L6I2_9LACO|nr:major facilitator superfamily permease [Liquorilactobacillus mali KCTC 3596 = DSM 20444]KRN09719.1 major facilitator superfamily permease [Liquorilactobacillus mali KCTC 3596 = DSM 20444]MDC7953005.1 SLC45 family MFS transporter [Liquorilactobacillus mali]MDV7758349.1 MFS transporter [Liquorilactobacillus mali]QFQ74009.1 SLC45 family MFS transporter [Liquorilactobacillus mali]
MERKVTGSISSSKNVTGHKKTGEVITNSLPKLPLSTIFAMTFGFFGVNMAFSLQSSQMGRIFQTIGANPTKLGFFFILPPLAGMVVQPLVGKYSDLTWSNKYGRRIPYLMLGAPIAALVMVLLPNAGSFGFGYASIAALTFGAIAILFMDLSSNVCMQPFKMIVGDMVNEDQKDLAWSWQQSFSNLGGVVATVFPFLLTMFGVSNIAKQGVVPLSVRLSFYIGAVILLATSIYTVIKVKEYDPVTYAEYHHLDLNHHKKTPSLWSLIKKAPRAFWEVSFVQLFDWFAFQYLWTYATGAIAKNVWNTANTASTGYQAAGNWYGILTCIQSIAAVIWGFLILSKTNPLKRKFWFRVGLVLGSIGFTGVFMIHNEYLLILPFCLIGISYLTMQTEAFSIFTSALDGKNEGAYMGLFNCGICLPQIIASVASFAIFPLINKSMPGMILVAGIVMLLGAVAVSVIKEDKPQVNNI